MIDATLAIMIRDNMSKEAKSVGFWTRARQLLLMVFATMAPLLLITVGILHTVWRERFALDWPAVTLLITGVVLLFVPLNEIAAKLLKLKIGNLEVEFQQKDLSEKVAEAETQATLSVTSVTISPMESLQGTTVPKTEADENSGQSSHASQGKSPSDIGEKPPEYLTLNFDQIISLRYEVDQLTIISPKAALVRLASALEQQVITMATSFQAERKSAPQSFRLGMHFLQQMEKMPPPIAEALSSFWRLRNTIVHETAPVSDDVVKPAIDNGFRLLLVLQNLENSLGA